MKKTISILLSVLLVCALMLPAGAKTIYPPILPIADENGYTYDVEETEGVKELKNVRYVGQVLILIGTDTDTVYVPKTLGDVAVTTENFDGSVFTGAPAFRSFKVDEDNTQFSVKDGLLFTKDGKTLVAVPNQLMTGIFAIPDGTEKLGKDCIALQDPPVEDEKGVCIVIPASVTGIDEAFVGGKAPVLAGYAGSAAQSFAEENGLTFVLLGEGHAHTYFRTVTEATCENSGTTKVICPCGDCIFTETTKPLGHDWYKRTTEREDGKTYAEIYCAACGKIQQSYPVDSEGHAVCSCRCHQINRTWSISITKDNWKDVFQNLIFRFKLAIWHLSGTHQYCECGARHF